MISTSSYSASATATAVFFVSGAENITSHLGHVMTFPAGTGLDDFNGALHSGQQILKTAMATSSAGDRTVISYQPRGQLDNHPAMLSEMAGSPR